IPLSPDAAAYGAAGAAILGLIFAAVTARWITRADAGSPRMQEIGEAIREGALAFLNREYRVLALFVVVVAALLVGFISWQGALAFVVAAILSVSAGNIGMRIATRANVRTAQAARTGRTEGLRVAFRSGAVMGFAVVGLGLLGITILWLLLRDAATIFGFSFGASSVALFARVGGGIYTKAGDVAGMGADLFESYAGSIIAALALGTAAAGDARGIAATFLLAGSGIVASLLGTFFVTGRGAPQAAMNRGVVGATILTAVLAGALIFWLYGNLAIWWAFLSGLVAGVVIGFSTEYFTSNSRRPAQNVAAAAQM